MCTSLSLSLSLSLSRGDANVYAAIAAGIANGGGRCALGSGRSAGGGDEGNTNSNGDHSESPVLPLLPSLPSLAQARCIEAPRDRPLAYFLVVAAMRGDAQSLVQVRVYCYYYYYYYYYYYHYCCIIHIQFTCVILYQRAPDT